jgi:hypothetical protein
MLIEWVKIAWNFILVHNGPMNGLDQIRGPRAVRAWHLFCKLNRHEVWSNCNSNWFGGIWKKICFCCLCFWNNVLSITKKILSFNEIYFLLNAERLCSIEEQHRRLLVWDYSLKLEFNLFPFSFPQPYLENTTVCRTTASSLVPYLNCSVSTAEVAYSRMLNSRITPRHFC